MCSDGESAPSPEPIIHLSMVLTATRVAFGGQVWYMSYFLA